jgi:hypothetical protein
LTDNDWTDITFPNTSTTDDSSKFSYFKAPIKNLQPYRQVTLVDVYKVITGGYFKIRTEKLRSIKNRDRAKEYKSAAFDYVTFSGLFLKRG